MVTTLGFPGVSRFSKPNKRRCKITYRLVRREVVIKEYSLEVTADTFSKAYAKAAAGSVDEVLEKEGVRFINELYFDDSSVREAL